MPRSWARVFLIALTIPLLPAAVQATRVNLTALQVHCCQPNEWSLTSWVQEALLGSGPRAAGWLQVCRCGPEAKPLEDLEAVMNKISAREGDPVAHVKLSQLYAELNLAEAGDQELAVARRASLSVLWTGLLARMGFAHQALGAYAGYRYLDYTEACAELRAAAEAKPGGTLVSELAGVCHP